MKSMSPQIDLDRIFSGVGFCVWAATKVTFALCILGILVFLTQTSFTLLIGNFFGSLFMLTLIGGVVTFFMALCIGIPVTFILVKLGLDDELISAVLGAMIVYLFFFINGEKEIYVLLFMIYGYFCAGEFMKGYLKGIKP